MGNLKTKKLALLCTLVYFLSIDFAAGDDKEPGLNLADAFAPADEKQTTLQEIVEEVEPIVVGREKWNEKPTSEASEGEIKNNPPTPSNSVSIQELDPLETQQNKTDGIDMKIEAPTIPPAVNLHRNFEGTLVLKPRTLGFQKNYPFQLENTKGRRLAFVDTKNLKVVDPLDYKDKVVNILGKLEPIEKGKKDLVIRARLLRRID